MTLTQREQVRLQVLNGVLADQVPVGQAAEILGVRERHVWRILAAYRKEGAVALAPGNRGRSPSNAVPEQVNAQVVALAGSVCLRSMSLESPMTIGERYTQRKRNRWCYCEDTAPSRGGAGSRVVTATPRPGSVAWECETGQRMARKAIRSFGRQGLCNSTALRSSALKLGLLVHGLFHWQIGCDDP